MRVCVRKCIFLNYANDVFGQFNLYIFFFSFVQRSERDKSWQSLSPMPVQLTPGRLSLVVRDLRSGPSPSANCLLTQSISVDRKNASKCRNWTNHHIVRFQLTILGWSIRKELKLQKLYKTKLTLLSFPLVLGSSTTCSPEVNQLLRFHQHSCWNRNSWREQWTCSQAPLWVFSGVRWAKLLTLSDCTDLPRPAELKHWKTEADCSFGKKEATLSHKLNSVFLAITDRYFAMCKYCQRSRDHRIFSVRQSHDGSCDRSLLMDVSGLFFEKKEL